MLTLDPIWGGPLRVWKPPEPGRLYCIGADPAGGKANQDWSAAVVVDCEHGSVVAVYRAHIEPTPFAQICFDLGTFYGTTHDAGQAFMVPEANNHGIALIDALRALGYWSLYARQTWDRIEKAFIPSIGFQTSIKTKPILLKRGKDALANGMCQVRDQVILEEASTFIINESGREEAMEGKHDDTLLAWLLALEGRHVFYVQGGATVGPEEPHVVGKPREYPNARDRRFVWESLEAAVEQRETPRRVTYISR